MAMGMEETEKRRVMAKRMASTSIIRIDASFWRNLNMNEVDDDDNGSRSLSTKRNESHTLFIPDIFRENPRR